MWRATRVQYHAVLYLRPDMLYNCPVPVQHLDNLHPNKIYIADFHHWRGYNDRFAMGTPRVAGAWGERCARPSPRSPPLCVLLSRCAEAGERMRATR